MFYVESKHHVKLTGSATIHTKKTGGLTNDQFVCGSNVISVKRMPKFKIEEDGLVLGDTLLITDTLNFNSKNIDLQSYDMSLPKSFSFNREGIIDEYIKTSSTGKYRLKILANDTAHIAPIGRNPYLPITAECTDCEGVEFAAGVTQGVYLNPDLETGLQTTNAVGETWTVIPNANFSGNITFTLTWNAGANGTTTSELSGFNRSNATSYCWIKNESSQWQNDGVNIGVTATGTDPYTIEYTFTNGMEAGKEYLLSVGGAGTALPVEFTYFNAKDISGNVELNWGTGTETDNEKFEVQRSVDGVAWEVIDDVAGAGTTLEPQDYLTYDNAPQSGINYYRLRQIDFDGKFDFSNVVKVVYGGSDDALEISSIFPNPFTSNLTVQAASGSLEDLNVQLLSSNGRVVKNQTFNSNDVIQFSGLDALDNGVYILRITQGNQMVTKQVLKK